MGVQCVIISRMSTFCIMIQVENVFLSPPGQGDKAKIAKRKFEVEEGDLLTLLNVYLAFIKFDMNKHWCSSHFLR